MTTTAAVATQCPAHPQETAAVEISGFVGAAIVGIVRRIAAARARARTMRILSSLDDQALKDIGLTRSRIGSIEHDFRYAPRHRRNPS